MKILVVDDDEVLGSVMRRAFQRHGHDTVVVTNEEDALLEAGQQQPQIDAAVLDLRLENGSGLNLVEPLLESLPEIRIVILTGYSSIATAVQAVKAGARDYLCKPASAEDVLEIITGDGQKPAEISASPPSVDRLEWEHIQRVLMENDGNISATARALGMHRRTLQRKLQKKPMGK